MIKKTIVEKALIRILYSKLGKVVNNWFRRRRNKKLLEELPFCGQCIKRTSGRNRKIEN